MKKIVRLTERDLTNIVKSVLNEKRLSASELIKDMTVRDIVDVVNSFSNKQISVKEVKEKIEYMFRPNGGRLNEMDEVLNEESDEIKKISDVERFFHKDDISLNDFISKVVDDTMDNIEPKTFKNVNHFSEEMGGLIAFNLLRGSGFYFKQKDGKYRNKVKEFLIEYIPKKYKSKLKSIWDKTHH